MVNNGSLSYDHERDGRPTELGGCTAIVRNIRYDTFLVIRYVKRHLTVSAVLEQLVICTASPLLVMRSCGLTLISLCFIPDNDGY